MRRCIAPAILGSAVALGSALAGCSNLALDPGDAPGPELVAIADPQPAGEGVAKGRYHFAGGEFGLAERYFQAAVEANPKNADAWLGLAASYDRLARFDLAERAYARVIALTGREATVLNNLGYHYLLQGKIAKARETLLAAQAKDPSSPEIRNNLTLLSTWKSSNATGVITPFPSTRVPA
jgi:Flp pilus assembly protein TadD